MRGFLTGRLGLIRGVLMIPAGFIFVMVWAEVIEVVCGQFIAEVLILLLQFVWGVSFSQSKATLVFYSSNKDVYSKFTKGMSCFEKE
ncbi:hypothetical protein Scep_026738 [Stephania cephalantha]|uniref:Uncharacterized protein n=1 Tax=Stephania cephalantha TaxID=152367 RepID=A0AAP0EL54_9MAGN